MTTILFYTYSGERNRINKTLENETSFPCTFNLEYNLINPTLKIHAESIPYNYCYIADVNRYYFIDRVVIRRAGLCEMYLTLDVLQTYKDKILPLTGTVTESITSDYLRGANIPVYAQTKTKTYNFKDAFNHNGTYVLIATGNVDDKTTS